MQRLLRKYSSSPVIKAVLYIMGSATGFVIAILALLALGWLFHIPVPFPFILMTVCS
jgi:hypothetical protein